MSTTKEIAKAFLQADGHHVHDMGDGLVVWFADELGRWFATVAEVNGCLVCCASFPVNVPEARRPAVAELLCRLNWPLLIGSWEMDLMDGEVRYRTSHPARSAELTEPLARDLCYTNFATFAHGWPAVLSVATGSATPADAFEAARAAELARRAAVDPDRQAFAAILERCGFAPGEDPWETPPSPGA